VKFNAKIVAMMKPTMGNNMAKPPLIKLSIREYLPMLAAQVLTDTLDEMKQTMIIFEIGDGRQLWVQLKGNKYDSLR
jgi:predicted NACHT family NTPase